MTKAMDVPEYLSVTEAREILIDKVRFEAVEMVGHIVDGSATTDGNSFAEMMRSVFFGRVKVNVTDESMSVNDKGFVTLTLQAVVDIDEKSINDVIETFDTNDAMQDDIVVLAERIRELENELKTVGRDVEKRKEIREKLNSQSAIKTGTANLQHKALSLKERSSMSSYEYEKYLQQQSIDKAVSEIQKHLRAGFVQDNVSIDVISKTRDGNGNKYMEFLVSWDFAGFDDRVRQKYRSDCAYLYRRSIPTDWRKEDKKFGFSSEELRTKREINFMNSNACTAAMWLHNLLESTFTDYEKTVGKKGFGHHGHLAYTDRTFNYLDAIPTYPNRVVGKVMLQANLYSYDLYRMKEKLLGYSGLPIWALHSKIKAALYDSKTTLKVYIGSRTITIPLISKDVIRFSGNDVIRIKLSDELFSDLANVTFVII